DLAGIAASADERGEHARIDVGQRDALLLRTLLYRLQLFVEALQVEDGRLKLLAQVGRVGRGRGLAKLLEQLLLLELLATDVDAQVDVRLAQLFAARRLLSTLGRDRKVVGWE